MKSHSFLKFRILLALLLYCSISLQAQILSSHQIDSLVEKTLTTFNVPGIAVSVIKDGKIIHLKGYGVRSIKTNKKVDENTLFGVASNTKAFTAAAVGMLVDEKKITWDTKVTDVIPEFKMYDAYVTSEFTIRDLLTHRSGLGLGAGDLMIWPDSSTVTKNQLIHNLRYLKPVSSFRTKYDYDNLMYIVAGDVVARVSGMTYENFIESRIIKPLGMTKTAASWYRLKDKSNVIDGHAPYEGKLLPVGLSFGEIANAAGGIYSNVTDMSKWVMAMMNSGKYGAEGDKKLFSPAVAKELWTPQTIIAGGNPASFSSYGLGWFLSNVNGKFQATHTGGLSGIVTQVTILPEMKLGIIVLTNQQSGAAFSAITNSIKDGYLGIKGQDRIKSYNDNRLNNEKEANEMVAKVWADIAAQQKAISSKPEAKNYYGTYRDDWFGEVTISDVNGKMHFQAKNAPKLRGDMTYYKGNTFIVKWYDRSLDADAFVNFSLDNNAAADGFKIEAISPLTDFSFDFQDLDFKKKP
ncbi:CubicO group peptidase (beta-lactamase class C family) [Pedobacter psychrotolerans]|uniref:CubicO group peptidase (Beta-lactamase class C family) n=1 Tax=Pedobacter psychrotolerans TaxID=1843235 RepID=A0A4R2HIM7_9SPHI|nr:serine hydrolase [Pedobacter psychrotolerans]TCO29153.1 CubicO group peptidase (beta-lactamase class C family) [Pedobacter psychrotolerans]GGE54604.1 serine hydrolase [Pedobacter psychrotolerans]